MRKLNLSLIPCLLSPPFLTISLVVASCAQRPVVPWYLDRWYIDRLKTSDITKEGGEIQTVKVNGIDHKVRLIGVDVDKQDEQGSILHHTTWEFVNLISDSNGYCLGVQWNDTSNIEANHDYTNSSIRKALNGTGNPEQTHILWSQKSDEEFTTWSETYKDKTVLDMLPSDFVDVIKPTDKIADFYSNGTWIQKHFQDKLFLLSRLELGYRIAGDYGAAYKYYENHTDEQDVCRRKSQVNSEEIKNKPSKIPVGKGQSYDADLIYSDAGVNYSNPITLPHGGSYWTRTPYDDQEYCYDVTLSGLMTGSHASGLADCVAPAFCI